MSKKNEAGRWAQLEAREKEMKIQLREVKGIKEGWNKMKAELDSVSAQLSRLKVEHVATVALCKQLKAKNTKQQARIIELEKLLREQKQPGALVEGLEQRDARIRELEKQLKGRQDKELAFQDRLLKEITRHTACAEMLNTQQQKHMQIAVELKMTRQGRTKAERDLAAVTKERDDALAREAFLQTSNAALQAEQAKLRQELEALKRGNGGKAADADMAGCLAAAQEEVEALKQRLADFQQKCSCQSGESKGDADALQALKEKLAQVMWSESELRRELEQQRQENTAEVQRRQELLTALSAEKAAAEVRNATLRERDDEIARLKLEAMKQAEALHKAEADAAAAAAAASVLLKQSKQGAKKKDGDGQKVPPGPAQNRRRKKKPEKVDTGALLTEIEMLKMMVDGAKKEVARRDKIIRRLKGK